MIDLEALYPKLIHLMLDTVFVVDSDSQIVFVSDACETLLGYRASELVGTAITDYMHPEDLAATRASIVRVMSGQPHIDFRNRALFEINLDSALRAAHRHRTRLALLFLDLNDFKLINDVHGHAMGDRILCEAARRLEGCVRETDTVARMGGDEFTVLLTDIHTDDAITSIVEQIAGVMAEPLGTDFGGIPMPSCSVGVACYPKDGNNADALLSHDDTRMYQIKRGRLAVG